MDYLTKDDLRSVLAEALAPYATRDEMRATFATREEVFSTFPTREEVFATFPTRKEMSEAIREDGQQTRRHFDVIAESLRDDIRMLAEGQAALHQRVDVFRNELKADIAALDRRVMRLEAAQR